MQPGTQLPAEPLYGMSRNELQVLKKYLEENLSKGFIWASFSPAAAPVLFVTKPGGGLWFCVDYSGLNALTVKNKYPLPLIRETWDRFCKAVYFTKLDIVAAFNKICMAEKEKWKTAFRTRLGLYEYLVMPFGLSNAPSSFQNFLNNVLGNVWCRHHRKAWTTVQAFLTTGWTTCRMTSLRTLTHTWSMARDTGTRQHLKMPFTDSGAATQLTCGVTHTMTHDDSQ